jgi:5'-3' exoribonuclease 1
MLGLVTHEPYFMLLREKMSVVMANRGGGNRKKKDMLEYNHNDFELLELGLLRQMLQLQFEEFQNNNEKKLDVEFSLERIIDDFVFMCMLVGNDFLPHMPHMEIDRGALSILMNTYADLLGDSWKGYLTDKEFIHPERFEEFVYHLAAFEEEHFKRRSLEDKEPGWNLSANDETDPEDFYGKYYGGAPTPKVANTKHKLPKEEIRSMAPTGNRNFRRTHPNSMSRSYRDFYYESKFGWKVESRNQTLWRRRRHVQAYMEGLHWNLYYYHRGCQSWDWFFPYLYAPLSTDLVNLSELYEIEPRDDGFATIRFEKGTPFCSLAQLLSVLPPQSASLLPKPLGELMTHPSSPLAPYYPTDFETDANGKRQSWEAIVKIPFIDADVMMDTVSRVLDTTSPDLLTTSERRRNIPGTEHVFVAPRERPVMVDVGIS